MYYDTAKLQGPAVNTLLYRLLEEGKLGSKEMRKTDDCTRNVRTPYTKVRTFTHRPVKATEDKSGRKTYSESNAELEKEY